MITTLIPHRNHDTSRELPDGVLCRVLVSDKADTDRVVLYLVSLACEFVRESWISSGPQGAD